MIIFVMTSLFVSVYALRYAKQTRKILLAKIESSDKED